MCPVCIATAAVLVGKAVSAGGFTALAVQIRKKEVVSQIMKFERKENQNGH
jgi:hypothetical protein